MAKKTPKNQRPEIRLLKLDEIRLDGDTQPRAEIDLDAVGDYAEAYRADATMPPLVVFFDGTDYWLADGFHRWHAAKRADFVMLECEIHQGTVEDARWYSYAANQTHGLRRSNADKAKAVKAALKHPAGAAKSNEQLAEHCGVDAKTVAKYRGELTAAQEIPEATERTGRDGRTINVDQIGKRSVSSPRDPETYRLGRCDTPGEGDCDCDACQELAALSKAERPGAYREAQERFGKFPSRSEIREVVAMWAGGTDQEAAAEDDAAVEEEADSDIQADFFEPPARREADPDGPFWNDIAQRIRRHYADRLVVGAAATENWAQRIADAIRSEL